MSGIVRALFGGEKKPDDLRVAASESAPLDRMLSTDQRLRCECGSSRPLEPVRILKSYALRQTPEGVRLIEAPSGDTVLCHACDRMLDVTDQGVFPLRGPAPPKAEASADGRPPEGTRPPVHRIPLDKSSV